MLAECDFCNTSSVVDETCCALDPQYMCPLPVQQSEAHSINACAAECLKHWCFVHDCCWPKQSLMLRPLWSLCTGPTAYVHVQCTTQSSPHPIRLSTEAPKDLSARALHMHTYYHQYQVKHNIVQKDPQTKHNPPKYHHQPSMEYWLTSVAHFVCIHRNIKNSDRSERQALACPSFRGGEFLFTFLKLWWKDLIPSYNHHKHSKKHTTFPIKIQLSKLSPTIPIYPYSIPTIYICVLTTFRFLCFVGLCKEIKSKHAVMCVSKPLQKQVITKAVF